jgi:hypothetical protein
MEKMLRNREFLDVPTTAFLFCVILIIIAIMGQTWWSIDQDKQLTISSSQENSYLTVRILEEHASRLYMMLLVRLVLHLRRLKAREKGFGMMSLPCVNC